MRTKSKISAYILRGSAVALLFSCAIVALSSAISLPNKRPKVPAPRSDTPSGVNGQQSASSVTARAIRPNRTLTFAERVAYQRAIEEVYWRHRIWPAANAGPKPSLDKIMSQGQIEKKVEDYLRNSQALEDYWQRPITPDQLQAEMERIASHTKQPGVLRELFAALGNNPFVIAECLARPILAERLITELYAHDQRFHGELKRRAEAELRDHASVDQMNQTSGTYTEMEWIKNDSTPDQDTGGSASPEDDGKANGQRPGTEPKVKLNGREWDESIGKLAKDFGNTKAGAAWPQIKTGVLSPLQEDDAHYYAVAVMKKGMDRLKLATVAWLKEPLRSWLAKAEKQVPVTMAAVSANYYRLPAIGRQLVNSKPSGTCTDDTWTPTSLTGAPAGRIDHTVVWTGSEMIVWGGEGSTSPYVFNSGGRYDPSTDSWTATSTSNAPSARYLHTAVWTGSEMIIWGGVGNSGEVNTGGRYNPGTDSWTATSTGFYVPNAREAHTAVWTGSEMIVWGGYNGVLELFFNNGGRYNPGTDSWMPTSTTSAPDGRLLYTAVWTGSEMIVWGGVNPSGYLNTGGRYNPGTDSWIRTSTTNAPAGRQAHTAVSTGNEMIVWGGLSNGGDLNTGGRYNSAADSWTATSAIGAPAARDSHTAVWTGSQMIVWGGFYYDGSNSLYLNTGGRYNPSSDSWATTTITGAPSARDFHTAIWTGSQMIVWGGLFSDGFIPQFFNTGGRYCVGVPGPTPTPTPTAIPTASPTQTPTATATPARGCADDTWTATSTVNVPDERLGHTAVWTGSEMTMWGGHNYDGGRINNLTTGGRYNPAADTWTTTGTTNSPIGRSGHTRVWTGAEVIVWGGVNYPIGELNTGGRYNPITDSWTATSPANAPFARDGHTAVWTGTEMIIWGGRNNYLWTNTGGRYNPSTDSWAATYPWYTPEARWLHTAVWTGSEMIVWGGTNQTIYLNTGGRYDPDTDRWTGTGIVNAPTGRVYHTAVWTGGEMIVWGGADINNDLNTGGRYNPNADAWTPTSITNAPTPREQHTTVWTGSEMIVWGGVCCNPPIFLNTGGRYNAGTDSWIPTSTANPPVARYDHTAVWTGTEMIIWGGGYVVGNNIIFLNTGGRYCAHSGVTPTPSPTPTATTTPSATPTATVTPTATPTSTPTPRATPTPRTTPAPRNRPTPQPRP